MLHLKYSHLYLESSLVKKIFGEGHHVFVKYMKDKNKILITPVTSDWFKMYKPSQGILKIRNPKGDKTLDIGGMLIDNDLDSKDRELLFEIDEKMKLITISL